MKKIQCPICGKMFNVNDVELLDNGNPACPCCVSKEAKTAEAKDEN